MKISHILVDMDPTREDQPALEKGTFLAKVFNATLELFLVDYHSGLVSNWFLDNKVLEKAKAGYINSKKRWIGTYLEDASLENIDIRADVRWHKPIYQGVIEKAKDCKADLVIKSTHRHPGINKIFFTPNDWQLLKRCPMPLLLCKKETSPSYRNIMAAIDPLRSHNKPEGLNRTILQTTQTLSERLVAVPHVMHCYEPINRDLLAGVGISAHGLGVPTEDHEAYLRNLRQANKEKFKECLKDYQFDEKRQYLEKGIAYKTIPETVVKHKIDLLIVGTTYRNGFLGSTIEKMLDDIDCDVLALKNRVFY